MNKLNIKLNQDYKQFKSGYDINLNGKLIIISGVNGSGKSQLMDIINGSQSVHPGISHIDLNKYRIDSCVSINGICLNTEEIFRRSFKDNINISNISMPNPKNSLWHKNEAWKFFSDYNLWDNKSDDYSKSKFIITNLLEEHGKKISPKFNASKPNNTDTFISEKEFIESLPDTFLWEKDDMFSNKIDDLFYAFAAKRHDKQAAMGRENGGFNNDEYIKSAPWTLLNELFEKLNFNYRFKNDYEFETPNLTEKPMIYPILNNGTIDFDSPRELSDLSDGEKSLISLTFALLNEKRRPVEKLLLLDEFDNTLNPSLIESLFIVIEEYFIKQGTTVILTSHSPVTISLAPEYATYYELFKQDNESPKILPVEKYQYSELKIANENFYNKIENQNKRIKELEENNKDLEFSKILFVEDRYTQIYKLAWLKLNNYETSIETLEEDFATKSSYAIFSKSNKDSLKGFLINPYMDEWNNKKIVGLFDFDDAYDCFKDLQNKGKKDEQIKWSEKKGTLDTGLYSKRIKYDNISALMLPVPQYRNEIASEENSVNRLEVELLFKDEDIKKIYESDYKVEKVIGNIEIPKIKNKENFWKKAVILPKERFEGFIPLFKIINELLEINEGNLIEEGERDD